MNKAENTFIVIKAVDGEIEIKGEFKNRYEAEERLVEVIADTISNFDDYEPEDIESIIELGYENTSYGSIYIEEDGEVPEGANI
jgi:hypothetical protein